MTKEELEKDAICAQKLDFMNLLLIRQATADNLEIFQGMTVRDAKTGAKFSFPTTKLNGEDYRIIIVADSEDESITGSRSWMPIGQNKLITTPEDRRRPKLGLSVYDAHRK